MMSSTADTDPFIQFQNELANLLESARTSFSSYLRIRALHAPTAAPSPELLSAQAELITLLDEISTDLSDLHATVRQMEADPYKFGLDVPEVVRRRRFVDEVEGEVGDMREELNSTSSSSSRQNAGAAAGVAMDDRRDEEGGGWNGYEMQYQQEIMHDQDEMLEGVSRTVVNLREQADVMNRELEEQTEMLGALDGDVDRAEHKLKKGVRDLNTFIRKNEDTASSCCIAILIMVLIFLLFLVVIL
ncbi:hypothetical protein L873DRAFT_1760424 [Choiromyces venosus 120613-1]|uniref:t-SNARE affecting a late Golgi compartment protein 1 n=1 Tax=Choiromyces venosus 120613-1 TaxID=1336337 RepID=A0A3N4JZT0_9PEZI|nr:hypothetical protein L873DRAFT_1760424 [Choiromyces venosus 120613-1]